MKFLDQAKVYIRSGDGGAGCVSFLREKFLEFGGPNGGNGGRGGDVVALCVDGLNTLIDYRYQQHYKARTGTHGMGKNRTGANGEDVVLRVPVGTQIFEEDNETLIADMTEIGQRVVLLSGGNGGFGNAHFKTSANQAPRRANPGLPGSEKAIWLRLKLIADAGLVGMPNAGKSTFLAAVSAAKPKIADYPFTTLHPNLGVVRIGERDFVLADIPGLIEGASEGAGLGHLFLRHLARTRVLLHLVDVSSPDPDVDPIPQAVVDARAIVEELRRYDEDLASKPRWLVLNKLDMVADDAADLQKRFCEAFEWTGPVYAVSGLTGDGTQDLIWALQDYLDAEKRKDQIAQDQADGTYVHEDPRFDSTRGLAEPSDAAPRGGDE